jgi:fibronectin type 3 domain-containing protein
VINWQQNPESDIQEYWIYRSRGCGKGRKLATVKATSSQFTDTSVESGNDYCYSVSGVDSDELEGERSEPYQINVPTELGVE